MKDVFDTASKHTRRALRKVSCSTDRASLGVSYRCVGSHGESAPESKELVVISERRSRYTAMRKDP